MAGGQALSEIRRPYRIAPHPPFGPRLAEARREDDDVGDPGVGDFMASALSFYLLYEASRLGVPKWLMLRMAANAILEGAVGIVPVAGDAFDIYFRANRRNVALLRKYFGRAGF